MTPSAPKLVSLSAELSPGYSDESFEVAEDDDVLS